MKQFVVDETDAKKRLDIFVVERLHDLSRAFVGKLLEQGKIVVNGETQKPGYKLKIEDAVVIDYDNSESAQIPDIDIPNLYEDDDCIVINKPAGLLSHSKGAFNPEATVATWLRRRTADGSQKTEGERMDRVGIVHRLDRGTSGVMIVAKNPEAMTWLQKQFSTRRVKKTYTAIVTGTLEHDQAVIDMPIERNPKKPQTFRVGSRGKAAKTHYKVLQVVRSQKTVLSLVELKPETGRTHQLRVHLNHMGHPIVGDTFYDGLTAGRLFLHATTLELTLPNHDRKIFSAPIPSTFKEYLKASK